MASLVLILVATFAGAPVPAPAEELVRFENVPFRGAEIEHRKEIDRGRSPKPLVVIDAWLSKPAGDGPFPALVYLHGCGGLSKSRRDDVAGLMTGWGYVTLAVDSFASRGLKHSCDSFLIEREG